ncbi:hypothetical protein ABAC460_08345 [Asticcacaulis sp. AC460]|uniref:hypothetical protein n=1 Tax=Asticcacaulis sp. AC460 TaxID=1282360 RepID=UPI0003C3B3F3|nr:hypothetical protein [Asticcacaulis sp. AC460]ESQ90829.1 hypothetical protein ABAC460_08345 [Asticcacaulis sp. AC460]
MRLFAGLAAAAVLLTGAPAFAQSVYEVVPAPKANRGQVADIAGVRTFTAEDGTYTVTLGPDDTTDVDNGIRFFTYGLKDRDHYVDMVVATDRVQDDSDILTLDLIQENIGDMLTSSETPSFLEGLTVTETKILTLGSGNGKTPIKMAVWIATDPKAPGTVTVTGGTLLPKGSLMVMIDCNSAADAEVALRDHLRLAEGVFE